MIFKNKERERDFWLVLGPFTIMGLPLLECWPLWQCCLSPGWREQGWGREESLLPSPALPQGSRAERALSSTFSLSTPSWLWDLGKRAKRAGSQDKRIVFPLDAPDCEFQPLYHCGTDHSPHHHPAPHEKPRSWQYGQLRTTWTGAGSCHMMYMNWDKMRSRAYQTGHPKLMDTA